MTNLNIAKLYLATMTTATTATQIDTAITDGSANTAVQALSTAAFVEAAYQAAFGRAADAEGAAYWADQIDNQGMAKDDAFMTALNYGATVYVAPTVDAPLVIGAVTFTAATVSATDDVAVAANKAAAEAAASTATAGSVAAAVVTVTEVASTVTVATETIDNGEYAAAATAYDAAVATAAISKAAADAAALTVSSVALATASQTAATAASTDATAVVTAAAALVAAATDTVSAADDITAATAATTAAAAATTATGLVTVATAAVTTATAAATAAAAAGNIAALTDTNGEQIFGTEKSDSYTADLQTYQASDMIIDSSTVDNDTLTLTVSDDIDTLTTTTVVGIENINVNITAITTTNNDTADSGTLASSSQANTFEMNAANISAGTLTLDVTKDGSSVVNAIVNNLKNGMTLTTDLAGVQATSAANADVTFNLNAAASELNFVSAADDLTINAAGDLDLVAALTADENVTITTTGDFSADDSDLNVTVTSALNNLVINSGGAIAIANTGAENRLGDMTLTAVDGITVFQATLDNDVSITTTTAGNVAATLTAADTVSITAAGDAAVATDTTATPDGEITVSAAAANSATLVAADTITVTSLEGAETVSLTAGNASTISTAISALEDLTLSTTNANGMTFDFTAGDLGTNGATDGLAQLETITIAGSNDVTMRMSAVDFNTAEGQLPTAQTTITATDSSTGTSRLLFDVAPGAAIDLTNIALDEIAFLAADAQIITVASGANIVVDALTTGNSLTNGLTLDAAAVPGNTVTVTIEDNNNGVVDTTVNALPTLITTDFATVTIALNDADTATNMVMTGALNAGADTDVVITGTTDADFQGAITAATFNSSSATGDITVAILNATTEFTFGAGDDSMTSAGDTDLTVDGGNGVDTLALAAATDYSDNTLTLSNIEVIAAAAAGSSIVAASQMTGQSYVIDTGALAINVVSGTGEVVDLADIANATVVTVTGLGGVDTITGSSATAMTIIAAGGDDVVTGGAAADVIYGDAGDDTITVGNGSDVVTGGADADKINVAETVDGGVDAIVYQALTDGSAAGAVDGTFADYDVITGFQSTEDKIVFDSTANIATNPVAVDAAIAAGNVVVLENTAAATATNDIALSELTDVNAVVSFLNDTSTAFSAAASDDIIAITFGDSNITALYATDDAASDDVLVAGDIVLLGTIDTTLVAGDIVI